MLSNSTLIRTLKSHLDILVDDIIDYVFYGAHTLRIGNDKVIIYHMTTK